MLVVLFTSSPTLPLSKWETDLKGACHADLWWTLNSTIPKHRCPLCREETIEKFYQDRQRDFFVCGRCQLVFVPPEQLLSETEEKAAYDCHQNSPTDPEYRRFLSRLFLPLRDRIAPESHGLDFGSGPGPTLSIMFEEIGHTITIYDHFYAKYPAALRQTYDFITATEVVEHLHDPATILRQLWKLLKPGGYFGLMTKLVRDRDTFATWHYKNDRTHVCFFSRSTFTWLAEQWQAEVEFFGNDAMLFYKQTNHELAVP
ncbi:MAG: class I SAM-dependent methyltransferase [Nitrospirota bacterium]|nr:class I SAM-dependent methyltransferase [Nitrospirota bacterium]